MFTPKHLELLINDLSDIYNSGEWCRNVPKFQTFPTLFEIEKNHWQNLKQNFIDNVVGYTGEIPTRVRAWCYANFYNCPQENWPSWHTHEKSWDAKRLVCGVLYLTPSLQGTIFLRGDKHFYLSGDVGVWNFFESTEVHSPPEWDLNNKTNRYCIAAEAIYASKE
jgi:hypothetical protein